MVDKRGFIRTEPIVKEKEGEGGGENGNITQYLLSGHCNSEASQIVACMVFASKIYDSNVSSPLQLKYDLITKRSKFATSTVEPILDVSDMEQHLKDIADESLLVEVTMMVTVSPNSRKDLSILNEQMYIYDIDERDCILVRNHEAHWLAIAKVDSCIWMYKPVRFSRSVDDTLERECSCLVKGFDQHLMKTDAMFYVAWVKEREDREPE